MYHVVTGTLQTRSAADAFSYASVSILIPIIAQPLISVVALRVEVN